MSRGTGVALALAVIGFAVITTAVGMASGAPPEFLALDLVMGMTFVGSGLAAVWLRPRSPAGPMLLVSGALWFVGSYAPSQQPVVMHLGFAFEGYYDLVLAALVLLLSTPMQRLTPRWLVVALGVAMVVRSLGRLLLTDPDQLGCADCPPNPFVIWPSAAGFEAVDAGSSLAIAVLAVTVGVVAIGRLLRSGRLWQRIRWPVILAGGVAMTAAAYDAFEYAWTDLTHGPLVQMEDPAAAVLSWSVFAGRTLVPLGFLAATLSIRSTPGPVGSLATAIGGRGKRSLEDTVRAALGDPSLVIVVRQPTGDWTAADGSPTAPPTAGPGRTLTLVGSGAEPSAVLVHDAALEEQPELLIAVASILGLALENDRLQAELRDQLRAVTQSRQRIVTAAEEERRRLERDLHDGAQQRLIGATLALQQARSEADSGGAPTMLRQQLEVAATTLHDAMTELRELARGIHPAVLEDAGLCAAVAGLARRSGIPVSLSSNLEGRLPRLVESTAYFTIAEALTNVQRHAGATHASVTLTHVNGRLRLEVSDDGRGGADPDRGSGLRGLADRVAALGGTLELSSDAGGTHLCAELPTS